MYLQQGDLVMTVIDSIPETAKLLKGERILHPGNTGNNHALDGGAVGIYQDGDKKYFEVLEDTRLTHNEHKAITITPGRFALTYVQEYDHFQDLQRPVVD